MQYIQLVEFNTNHPVDEVKQALDAWLETSRGKRTLHMAVVGSLPRSPRSLPGAAGVHLGAGCGEDR